MFFGLLPALAATRLDLVRTMRGDVGRSGSRPGRARSLLMVAQVTAAALLLIAAGVFLRGALRAVAADPGLRLAGNILIDVVNEPLRPALLDAIATEPRITMVAATAPELFTAPPHAAIGAAPARRGSWPLAYRFVSPEFFDVLEVGVVRGRTFTSAEASSATPVAVVSQALARQIWLTDDAVGQVLRIEPHQEPAMPAADDSRPSASTFVVIGVVANVPGIRLAGPEANVYLPATHSRTNAALIARVSGDTEQARTALVDRLVAVDPNMGMVVSLETLGRLEAYPLQFGFWLTVTLGVLALGLTLSGLYGVISYLVTQRTKEFGVRMALGATPVDVMRLVLAQSMRLVLTGLIAGAGLAWLLATLLLTTPATESIGGIVDVRDPLAYVGSVVCIVIACVLAASVPAQRAARVDPIMALRHD